MISLNAVKARLAKLPLRRCVLPLSVCALSATLALDSWDFIQQLPKPTAPDTTPAPTTPPLAALDPQVIASLFGAMPPEMQVSANAVPLTLLASLAAPRSEDSRALIRTPEITAFYSVGDRLPGGANLSSISPDHVTIMRGGRAQVLAFPSHTARLLTPTPVADAPPPLAEIQP
ncbi:type II secretion system protein N [Pseudomonas sp. CF161]|uniref:type II secretion system protein N n=1 Tax=Pseudomonas sp. CF161 TaxID=911241 RepID=UPI0003552E1D|nr:type II secretion system protein N [Pseudomonas sp. CF161]EPL08056.1 outer membrane secretion protein P [Pseudomonas sp. CF161]